MYLLSGTNRSGAESFVNIMQSGIETYIIPPTMGFAWQLRSTSANLTANRYDQKVRSSSNLWPSDIGGGGEYVFPEGLKAQPFPSCENQWISVVGQHKELNKTGHSGIRYTTHGSSHFEAMTWALDPIRLLMVNLLAALRSRPVVGDV